MQADLKKRAFEYLDAYEHREWWSSQEREAAAELCRALAAELVERHVSDTMASFFDENDDTSKDGVL